MALHKETLVFKLSGETHPKALSQKGAVLWDPSGKGRPMKAWVAIPAENLSNAKTLATEALTHVSLKPMVSFPNCKAPYMAVIPGLFQYMAVVS